MILGKLQQYPEKRIPVAMALVTTGLMILIAGIVWPAHALPIAHSGTDWGDFFRGFVFGFAIVLELSGLVILAAAKRKQL